MALYWHNMSYLLLFILLLPLIATCYPPSHIIPNVPYDRQVTVYDCGCASLQMVFSYWNASVNQYSLANIARTSAAIGTSGLDIVRTGHFSILSASSGLGFPEFTLPNGIPGKPLGFAAFGYHGTLWLDELKECIAANMPIIILMNYELSDLGGHFRVAVGYDENNQTITLHDPWGRDGQPHNVTFSYNDFVTLWNYTETAAVPQGPFFGAMIAPFDIQTQVFKKPSGSHLVIQSIATYPILPPFTQSAASSTISNVLLSLQLPFPTNFTISKDSSQSLNIGAMNPGESAKASWEVECANTCYNFSATVEVRGFISGSVPSAKWHHSQAYPPYQYVDVIGGTQSIFFS